MTGRMLLAVAGMGYVAAYLMYGRYLKNLLGISSSRKTPAHMRQDGVDFVPAKAPVLFGHHFASIAGAGPIVGPVLAACFGWGPVALWLIFGCIFIGSVHDFSSLIISVRNSGQTIGHIVERYISYPGRQIFLVFCTAALVLVVAIFALLIAKAFVASPSVATSSILFVVLAVVFGFVQYRGKASLIGSSTVFIPLIFFAVYLGARFPLDLTLLLGLTADQAKTVWLIGLLGYVFVASVLPVWILLQPRDYLNSYLLYAMIFLGLAGILIVNPALNLPFFSGFTVSEPTKGAVQWNLFPILFVTVACGACSGFHAMVSSGTTSKQLSDESHALPVGYGAMLIEGVIGIIVLISVAMMTPSDYVETLRSQGTINTFSAGLAQLCAGIGLPVSVGRTFISLTISAFMLTTLDTATRLTRFTIHEMALPKFGAERTPSFFTRLLDNRYWATLLVVVISGYLAISGDAGRIWPVFGASNQLLAALTLLILSLIFWIEKRNVWVVFLPFLVMLTISSWALMELFLQNFQMKQWILSLASLALLVMAVVMVLHFWCVFFQKRNEREG